MHRRKFVAALGGLLALVAAPLKACGALAKKPRLDNMMSLTGWIKHRERALAWSIGTDWRHKLYVRVYVVVDNGSWYSKDYWFRMPEDEIKLRRTIHGLREDFPGPMMDMFAAQLDWSLDQFGV